MSKAIFIFGLVAAAAAATVDLSLREQKIQLGSVGSYSANLSGVISPIPEATAADGTLTYRFSSVVKGTPVPESDYYRCRCNVVEDFYVPLGARSSSTPVLLCRSVAYETTSAPLADADKMAFLLYSDKLAPNVKKINLLLGKAAYQNFLASHAAVAAPPAAALRESEDIVPDKPTGRQIYGYGITATSPNGFSTVSTFGTGGLVTWTSTPAAQPPAASSPPKKSSKDSDSDH